MHLLVLFRVNDIIVSVNGISTVNVTHGQAVDALKRAGNVVHLVGAFCFFLICHYKTHACC